ncbi:3-hydroxyacyl-[acyl-carrier-protein] dehydratase FabZ [Anaerofustis stercorihominis]|uniref:3-hydroxyacyl-[acyl-carrier-protein] dehydratase n=1 Tax=Anaerofustis stercorihominis TaxID=214853 RepID=A0A3E3DVK3_9FIRM|nr:3-hydroxyacyl-ACP dehydratase FabZ [Anaerofustis stercorihominis]RGD73009.1 3-hydroxyacyl-[acyl-carrier-protein] dehydratase FabZ [Anaerofustis stercorihominis]
MIYNSNDIQKIIPHRYPFLLVDTIEEIIDDTVIIGKKCVSANEMQFMGHFPEKHVMPGVLMIEALAQTGAVLLLSKEENKGKIAVLAGVNKIRFKRQVIPGDTLTLKVELTKMKAGIGFANATALVGDEIAVKGEIMFAVEK